jgi:hypothetical protein
MEKSVNQVGNALASGGSTFTSDDDPDLVATAIPFFAPKATARTAATPIADWSRPPAEISTA